MTRGPISAAGGLYEANMVADGLAGVGAEMADISSALDFGCSSGRVVRVLAAAYPDIEWHGCDPNAPAIAWANEHLPGIDFFVSGDAPPLPLPDAALDLAYAISIWSHFAPSSVCAGSQRCTASSAQAGTWCAPPTASPRSPTTPWEECAAPAVPGDPRDPIARERGTRQSSARRATGASSTPTGAQHS